MVIRPPIAGPITGAIRAGQVKVAIACTSCDLGVVRRTTSRPTGAIRAAAAPCRIRAATKGQKPSLSPHKAEAEVKTPIAPTNTVRDPNRSAAQLEAGISAATVSR